jgi:hypothetical protein
MCLAGDMLQLERVLVVATALGNCRRRRDLCIMCIGMQAVCQLEHQVQSGMLGRTRFTGDTEQSTCLTLKWLQGWRLLR